MTFGEDWTFGASVQTSRKMFDAFCAAGGTFVDTANTYTCGTSERLVGEFVASEREYFVVSTKYSLSTRPDDPNGGGNSRKTMVRSLEDSLRQVRTDFIDVFWVHAWDGGAPVQEVMRGLDDLVRTGKVRYVGVSNTPGWVVAQATTLAELRGWTSFVGLQTEYSLMERTAERELLPMARALGLGVLAWAPLGGGVLTGKYVLDGDSVSVGDTLRGPWLNGERLTRESLGIAANLVEVAQEAGRPPAQVALSWLRQQPGGLIPIIAGRSLEQLEQNLGCLDLKLTQRSCSDSTSPADRASASRSGSSPASRCRPRCSGPPATGCSPGAAPCREKENTHDPCDRDCDREARAARGCGGRVLQGRACGPGQAGLPAVRPRLAHPQRAARPGGVRGRRPRGRRAVDVAGRLGGAPGR
jgi:aryl-alcohol dehydrogenase-like predicted oxidoreductase